MWLCVSGISAANGTANSHQPCGPPNNLHQHMARSTLRPSRWGSWLEPEALIHIELCSPWNISNLRVQDPQPTDPESFAWAPKPPGPTVYGSEFLNHLGVNGDVWGMRLSGLCWVSLRKRYPFFIETHPNLSIFNGGLKALRHCVHI